MTLTLGELTEAAKAIELEAQKPDPVVVYDFGEYPDVLKSWRGLYSELALGHAGGSSKMSLSKFIKMLEGAEEATFQGYKGGDYKMDANTSVWVSNPGQSDDVEVVELVLEEGRVVIKTHNREADDD